MDLCQRGRARRARRLPRGTARTRSTSAILIALLASPSVASKKWAFEQDDSVVLSHTVPSGGRGRSGAPSPRGGGLDRRRDRRQRAPRRLRSLRGHDRGCARVRAEPGLLGRRAARADQLPELRQPREARGRLAAGPLDPGPGRRLRSPIPVVGGNVSLYNETEDGPIYPTPVVGMVGELPDPANAGAVALGDGDAIAVCGPFSPSLAGSSWPSSAASSNASHRCRSRTWPRRSPSCATVRSGAVSAAHDVSDGGLACALAEAAIAGRVGLEADLDPLVELRGCSGESGLFGEGPGGFVLAGPRPEPRSARRGGRPARGRHRGRGPDRDLRRRGGDRRPARGRRARLALARRADGGPRGALARFRARRPHPRGRARRLSPSRVEIGT